MKTATSSSEPHLRWRRLRQLRRARQETFKGAHYGELSIFLLVRQISDLPPYKALRVRFSTAVD